VPWLYKLTSPDSVILEGAHINGVSRPWNLSWILKTLLGQSFILLLPLPLFFGITSVAEVVVKLVLQSKPLHVLIVHDKVLLLTLCKKSFSICFSQQFVRTKGIHFVPPKLHKPTLVGPPSMRDDLHNYLLSLLLQLFRILNICLNRVFEEYVLFIFGQVFKSLHG
jgi:hypothetical protein